MQQAMNDKGGAMCAPPLNRSARLPVRNLPVSGVPRDAPRTTRDGLDRLDPDAPGNTRIYRGAFQPSRGGLRPTL